MFCFVLFCVRVCFPSSGSPFRHDQPLFWQKHFTAPSQILFSYPNLTFLICIQLFLKWMPQNEFEFTRRREFYEWTNLSEHWRMRLLTTANSSAQFAIGLNGVWFWLHINEFHCRFVIAITFRTKALERNVKLIGDSLNLTGKTYINTFQTADLRRGDLCKPVMISDDDKNDRRKEFSNFPEYINYKKAIGFKKNLFILIWNFW